MITIDPKENTLAGGGQEDAFRVADLEESIYQLVRLRNEPYQEENKLMATQG